MPFEIPGVCLFDHFLYTTNVFGCRIPKCTQAIIKSLGDWVSCHQSKSVIALTSSEMKQSHTDVCSRQFCAHKQFIWYHMAVLSSEKMVQGHVHKVDF